MKNLIAELLVTLAHSEEESKKLAVQVEALEMVVTTLVHQLKHSRRQAIAADVESKFADAGCGPLINNGDRDLLHWHLNKILH